MQDGAQVGSQQAGEMLEICRDLRGSEASLPSLVSALLTFGCVAALPCDLFYNPEGTAEFLLQQQYFFVVPMPRPLFMTNKAHMGKAGWSSIRNVM